MTAARTLTDADVEAIAERVAEKLRGRRRAVAVEPDPPPVSELDAARARTVLQKLGMLPPRGGKRAPRR